MMTSDFDRCLRYVRLAATWLGAACLTLVLVLTVGTRAPVFEELVWPVWGDVGVEFDAGASASTIKVHVYGNKLRSECRFLEVAVMTRQASGRWARATLQVDGRAVTGYTRPEGWQDMGVWTITPGGDALRIYAYYRCHDMWDTFAMLGEWPTPVVWEKQ